MTSDSAGEAPLSLPEVTGPRTLLYLSILASILGVAALTVFLIRFLAPVPSPSFVPAPIRPAEFVPAAVGLPSGLRYVDVTESAGLRFVHSNGAAGRRLLPETMGSGGAFLDFDRDGDQDIVLVNSCPWPGEGSGPPPTQALYENDGKGGFRDATVERGLAVSFYGMGVAIGDTDGDGWDDVFFTAVGGDRLFRNDGGRRFVEITREAGIPEEGPHVWSSGAAFLDYDLDGNLDLFVCRYVAWSPEVDLAQDFQITGIGRAYGPPQNFAGVFSRLYRNVGGKFVDVSKEAGVEVRNQHTGKPMGKALAVAVWDLDDDSRPDIAVANDTVQNFLFHNRGDGRFEEVGIERGFAFDTSGNTRGAMGIDCADLDAAGMKAILVGNFANEITALYRSPNAAHLPFRDDALVEGIGNPSRKYMKFGVLFLDLDLDGRLDIVEANGHLEHEISTVQAEQTYEQPAQVFWNAGPRSSRSYEELRAEHLGADLFRPVVGRGLAAADIDGDGDLDLLLTSNGGRARLFRLDGAEASRSLRLKLRGTRANRNAFGSRVRVRVGDETRSAQLTSGRAYLSQCEQVLTFGLGRAEAADSVEVFWPGERDPVSLGRLPAGKLIEVTQ